MKTYRTAVVGTGFIGMAHIEALRRLGNVEVVALCDALNARERAEQANINAYYYDFAEMFDKEELDVVHICTPNNTHFEIAVAAMRAGIDVFCEKPMCLDVAEAEEMLRIRDETGRKAAINFHNRCYPMVAEMRSLTRSGELGEIFDVHGSYVQDWMSKRTDYSWHIDRAYTGMSRTMADIGLHWIDLAQNISGSKVVEVLADFKTLYQTRFKADKVVETFAATSSEASYTEKTVDTEDHCTLMVRFENGATGTAVISQVTAGRKNKIEINLSGTEKSVSWCSDSLNDLWIGLRDGHNQLATKGCHVTRESLSVSTYPSGHCEGFPDAFKHNFAAFYASLDEEDKKEVGYATFEDGLHLMKVLTAAYVSSNDRRWVPVG